MKEVDLQKVTRTQVDAFLECIDLVRNGYIQCFALYQSEWWYIKYRHMVNGRTLTIEWKPDWYAIREGKKVLKIVDPLGEYVRT